MSAFKHSSPRAEELEKGLHDARVMWERWKPCFSHQGELRTHPVLASHYHFGCFMWEYGLSRTIQRQPANRLRAKLLESKEFHSIMANADAEALVKMIKPLSAEFGITPKNADKPRQLLSLMTKLAAFCRPDAFIAYDSYASKGLSRLVYGSEGRFFSKVSEYVHAARSIVEQPANYAWGPSFFALADASAQSFDANKVAFRMRALDGLSMRMGGYEGEI